MSEHIAKQCPRCQGTGKIPTKESKDYTVLTKRVHDCVLSKQNPWESFKDDQLTLVVEEITDFPCPEGYEILVGLVEAVIGEPNRGKVVNIPRKGAR